MFNSTFSRLKEPFTEGYTSCTQITSNCSDCTTAKITDTNSPCYWNSQKKQCGSFKDQGYCGKSDPSCCNSTNGKIGGCNGTEFGCCPDGTTTKKDQAGSNCASLPSLDDNNANILNDIQSLQTIENNYLII